MSPVRRFNSTHSSRANAKLLGAGHRKVSFLSLALFLLTFHFSPALVSAQDVSSARKNCDTAALAKSVWGDGNAAEALLAELDTDCATRLINEYTTEKDETIVRATKSPA